MDKIYYSFPKVWKALKELDSLSGESLEGPSEPPVISENTEIIKLKSPKISPEP